MIPDPLGALDGVVAAMEKGARIAQGARSEVLYWSETQVLKLMKDVGSTFPENELKATTTAHGLGLPVPHVGELVEFDRRQGVLLERIEGRTLWDEMRSEWQTPEHSGRVMAKLHAAIHAQRAPELPSLRAVHLTLIRDEAELPESIRDAVLNTVEGRPDSDAMCHGDFHPLNILMAPRGPVSIDWAASMKGDPLADVARTRLILNLIQDHTESERTREALLRAWRSYLVEYRRLRPFDDEDLDAWRIPVAAMSLAIDRFPEDRPKLLRFIESRLVCRTTETYAPSDGIFFD